MEGLPSMRHPEDPAWICARGPFPEAQEDRAGLLGSHSFERFCEVRAWAVQEGNAAG